MKIAFARFNDDISVSYYSIGQGIEHRVGFLHALVEQGHEVTLVSPVRKRERILLRGKSLSGNSWLNKMKYDTKADGSKFDVFILECGSNNMRYTRTPLEGEEEVNIIDINVQKLKQFRGKVLFWHHIYGKSVIFPFGAIYDNDGVSPRDVKHDKPVEKLGDWNWNRIFDGFDPFEGKEWEILHHCLNEEEFKKIGGRYDFTYGMLPRLKFRYLHLPQSRLDEFIPGLRENPQWDALFIGSQQSHMIGSKEYSRLENVKRFYDTKLYKAGVLGNFSQGDFSYGKVFQDAGSNIPIAVHNWNDSYTHIFTESPTCQRTGSITGRTFLSLQGGSILLLDKGVSNISKMEMPTWEVQSSQEARDLILAIKELSPARRDEIRRQQLETFPYWEDLDWSKMLS